jgi:hypothetical protein
VPLDVVDLTIQNNVFAARDGFTHGLVASNVESPAAGVGLVISHNAWWGGDGQDVTRLYSDIPVTGDAASLYNVDPRLAAPPDDLAPAADSPLLGRGIAVSPGPRDAALPAEIRAFDGDAGVDQGAGEAGEIRTMSRTPSIGAF